MAESGSYNNGFLEVAGVTKSFVSRQGALEVLRSTSFCVGEGEVVCLVGPSGSGKSTLLRIVGGLLAPDAGEVRFRGLPVTAPHPDMGFVFQSTNLMPWRTVLQNVLLPLEVEQGRVPPAEQARARDLLQRLGLAGFEDAYPRHLSGGMAQRVVLARTLVHRPALLLMDEPFGALDALTRERLNLELLELHTLEAKTILLVTHSINEAVFLADRVLVLGPRPARLVGEVAVDLPRPRGLEEMAAPEFNRLAMAVRGHIGQLAAVE